MSTEAGWWACARNWYRSPMFRGVTTPGPMLAWIGLLTHASAFGRGGRIGVDLEGMRLDFRVTEDDVKTMLANAERDGAVKRDGKTIVIVNWRAYQDSHVRRKNAKNAGDARDFSEMPPTAPTSHQSPVTHHPSQEEQNAARSPATAAKPAVSGGGKSPMSGGKTPTGKTEPVTLDRERWVWVGTEGRRAAWEAAYPAVDIDAELAKAAVWCRENGAKGHRKNFGRFLANWLSRQQERGGTRGGVPFAPVDPAAQHKADTDRLIAELKARDDAKEAGRTPW